MEGCGLLCDVNGCAEFTTLTCVTAFISTLMESNRLVLSWLFLLVSKGYMDRLPSRRVKNTSTMFTGVGTLISDDVIRRWYDLNVVG